MVEQIILETEEQIKAFTHPYRLKILQALRDYREPATATDIARVLGDGPGKVHYHVKILEQAGIVRLVDTLMINGILARKYEPSAEHYIIKPETVHSEQKNDLYKMISKRFKDGFKQFFDSSFDNQIEQSGGRPRSFLYEFVVYCDDDEWISIQQLLNELSKTYAHAGKNRKKRRIFIAGATESAEHNRTESETSSQINEQEIGLIWTFGFTGMSQKLRTKPFIPHDE
ncbi:MAG TPA: helix-turn-helix domain-containing protein [Spirochaetia bacterium]|nr:helix-turn-helix domain-containing protein [Spirochaetales bacterium]HRS66821.1 helix-turn-helix domain-containing protein [Spirochaetia bacterium]HOT59212.1 helix-turn-helix domain-containing protein [Spirochaetales bacterium]HPD79565.1 helix-turn-helix domain-containing protein [Spirochaetales bacterium]HQG40399.1 helix-turn-helix domain-containing protein [Spirochaetales bacterium]